MNMRFADLVILNGKVLTIDYEFTIKEAMAVKDGIIIKVGKNENVTDFIGPETKVIDLQGKTILPGAHDAHMHGACMGLVANPNIIDLYYPNIKSLKEMRETIADRISIIPGGEWVIGGGWNTLQMEEFVDNPNHMLSKADIDDITPDNPVYLIDFSSHVLLANSKALKISGITKETPDPAPGVIVRDPETGEPTGLFLDYAAEVLITKNAPLPTYNEIQNSIKVAQSEFNKQGITSHTDILGVGGDYLMAGMFGTRVIESYHRMKKSGELTCRVSIGVWAFLDGVHSYQSCLDGLKQTNLTEENDWIRYWLKIWGDGMPQNFTAWMWNDQICGHHGKSNFPGETDEEQYDDLLKTIKYLHRNKWQIGLHACGDQMVERCLDAYIEAIEEFPLKDPRHYIIHGELTADEQLIRAAKYGIGLSVQPTVDSLLHPAFVDSKIVWGKEGNKTPEEMSAYKTYMDLGVNVAGGSDCPVTLPNWRQGVQDAITRKDALGNVYNEKNVISIQDAIRMYTINGAIQEKMEHLRGSIEVGKVADFQVLAQDILNTPIDKIGQISVIMTIVEGKIVYSI